MLEFRFNPGNAAPIVTALLKSPRGARKVRLIFDTGAARTQLHQRIISSLGYKASMKVRDARAIGVGGAEEIDGLLGWDIIRRFRLEMDGPKGVLKVLDLPVEK